MGEWGVQFQPVTSLILQPSQMQTTIVIHLMHGRNSKKAPVLTVLPSISSQIYITALVFEAVRFQIFRLIHNYGFGL